MGDKNTIVNEFIQGFEKALIWLAYITVGVLAKLAFDSRNEHLTRRQIVIKVTLSIFAGYMASVACEATGYTKFAGLIVPVATLLGEGFIVYLMKHWQQLAAKVLPWWFGKKK